MNIFERIYWRFAKKPIKIRDSRTRKLLEFLDCFRKQKNSTPMRISIYDHHNTWIIHDISDWRFNQDIAQAVINHYKRLNIQWEPDIEEMYKMNRRPLPVNSRDNWSM